MAVLSDRWGQSAVASSATRPHPIVFDYFWISQKLGGVTLCQDGDDQQRPTERTAALQKPVGLKLNFYTVYVIEIHK